MVLSSSVKERVTEALVNDSHTADAPIEVIDNQGVVTLDGVVASHEVREAAEQVARQQEGVINVINDLEVEG
jgi:osmotically-inducible protein OsmY